MGRESYYLGIQGLLWMLFGLLPSMLLVEHPEESRLARTAGLSISGVFFAYALLLWGRRQGLFIRIQLIVLTLLLVLFMIVQGFGVLACGAALIFESGKWSEHGKTMTYIAYMFFTSVSGLVLSALALRHIGRRQRLRKTG